MADLRLTPRLGRQGLLTQSVVNVLVKLQQSGSMFRYTGKLVHRRVGIERSGALDATTIGDGVPDTKDARTFDNHIAFVKEADHVIDIDITRDGGSYYRFMAVATSMNYLLITVEILFTVVAPLLVLYLRGTWKQHTMMACMSTIPVLWYFAYAPIHELSHLFGAYLVGARIVEVKLIPRFWAGETAVAWIKAEGFTNEWSQLIMTASPYILDLLSIAIGVHILQRRLSRNAFLIGFLFMVLCLRPAFDFVCETIGFANGFEGDLFHIALTVGDFTTWAFLVLSIAFSIYAIVAVIGRFKGFPRDASTEAT
jgi:hypothetical protein